MSVAPHTAAALLAGPGGAPARAAALAASMLAAAPAAGQETAPVVLPSGLEARLQEVIRTGTGEGRVARFRFVAPGLEAGGARLEATMNDLEFLCRTYAAPRLDSVVPGAARVVISLADRPSEFGVTDADMTQVFEAYRVVDGSCIWEMF
ncbi:DUF6497 family protein [Roseovarius salinarum]|uniref:DUF6497 family protein n=1 Tax=Roseovarius salinarum TaxID=1981892 RepID=UPI001E4A4625|nr:DUF6497 family protein [Roseovarius salinarum]